MTDSTAVPHIKGSHVAKQIGWIKETYGSPTFANALARLPEHERALFDKGLLTTSEWYPLSAWDALLAAVRVEVHAATGESEERFDERCLREGGGRLMNTLFKVIFFFADPASVLDKLPKIMSHTYDCGSAEVVENTKGRAVLRYTGPRGMHGSIKRFGPPLAAFLTELAGAKQSAFRVLREQEDGRGFTLDFEVTYQ